MKNAFLAFVLTLALATQGYPQDSGHEVSIDDLNHAMCIYNSVHSDALSAIKSVIQSGNFLHVGDPTDITHGRTLDGNWGEVIGAIMTVGGFFAILRANHFSKKYNDKLIQNIFNFKKLRFAPNPIEVLYSDVLYRYSKNQTYYTNIVEYKFIGDPKLSLPFLKDIKDIVPENIPMDRLILEIQSGTFEDPAKFGKIDSHFARNTAIQLDAWARQPENVNKIYTRLGKTSLNMESLKRNVRSLNMQYLKLERKFVNSKNYGMAGRVFMITGIVVLMTSLIIDAIDSPKEEKLTGENENLDPVGIRTILQTSPGDVADLIDNYPDIVCPAI